MAQRKVYREDYQKHPRLALVLKILLGGFLFFVFGFGFLFLYYGRDLPRPEKFAERQLFQPTGIYDRSGEVLLYQIFGEEKREPVSIEEIPEHLIRLVLVAEDADFYHHFGLDWKGVARALLVNLKLGQPIHGGSTISQQLIRSTFLTLEKTLGRKIKEVILTLDLERRYSKEQILEFYLNQIPLGENCYGVQSAAKTYFKKPVSEISVPEAAVLASLIRGPTRLSPYRNRNRLLQTKDHLLDRMVQEGHLTQAQAEEFKSQEIEFAPFAEVNPLKAPHLILETKNYLIDRYGEDYLRRQGLKVYTTIDWELQEKAEIIVKELMETNKHYNAHNAALVALDPRSGQILAMVGSKDFFGTAYPEGCDPERNQCLFAPQFNVATLGKRQPGSAFKPFAYLTAFEKGYTAETIIWDVRTNFETVPGKTYIPQNYTGTFKGPVSLREALAQSINVPSIKALYLAGGEDTLNVARKMGIASLKQPFSYYGLPLVLGGGEVTLLEIVSAYGVLAQDGYGVPPISILKIENAQGKIIEQYQRSPQKIVNSHSVRIVNDILSDNQARAPVFGANSALYFENYQVAAKTGTTQDFKDGWAIGYTPNLVTGVWVGNNDNSPTLEKPGLVLAGPIFHQFMAAALKKYPPAEFPAPEKREMTNPILAGQLQEPYHSILHYVKKEDPLGPAPEKPQTDPQYLNWEKGIKEYILKPGT